MCSVEDLKIKRIELRAAGILPEERPDVFNRIRFVTRPQYPGDIYIGDTYIPEKDIPS